MKAGTLELELIANVERLKLDMRDMQRTVNQAMGGAKADAQQADRALQQFAGSGGRAVQQYAGDVARLKGQLDPAWKAQQTYNSQVQVGMAAMRQGAITREQFIAHMRQINTELKGTPTQMAAVTASVGAQRAGMQQLGFQINDVATQFASGTKPMQIFGQQAGQIIQSVQLMTGSTSKLGAFLGGPWGIAITAATVVLVPMIGKLFETKNALDDVKKSAQSAMDALYASLNQASAASNASTEATKKLVTASAQIAQANAKIAETQKAADEAARMFGGGEAAAQLYARLGALEKLKKAGEDNLKAARREIETIGDLAKVRAMQDRNQARLNATEEEGRKTKTKLTDAEKAQIKAMKDAAREQQRAYDDTEQYIESLRRQNEEFGKSEKELRAMEMARRLDAAQTAQQRAEIELYYGALENKLGSKKLTEGLEWQQANVRSIQDEIDLLGLVGPARDRATLALEEQAYKAEALARGVVDVNSAWDDYYQKQLQLIAGRSYLEEQRLQAQLLEEQVRALTGAMGQLGGIGGLFGDVAGVLTSGNPIASLLGMGGVGTLLGIGFGGSEPFEKLAKDFEDTLRGTFGVNGQFASVLGSTLSSVFQGAGVASGIGAAAGALGLGKSASNGAAVGSGLAAGVGALASSGALGFGGAQAFLSTLGGPVGMIGGALVGILGSELLKSTPRGKATFSGLDYSLSGNSGARKDQAGQLADQVLGGLQQLAETLGGTIEWLTGTIGIRKDSLRYDPTGQGITKTSKGAQQYADEGALIAAVIADQIAKGVLKGLSPQSEALLKGPGPIEERIAKAQAFEAALGQLAETLDPAGAALKAFDAQAKALRDLFAEAGATTQQTAELEAALAKDRLEIEQQYAEEAESNARGLAQKRIELLEAEGKVEEARAAARTLYLEDLDAEEAAIQQQIWAALDLAEARAKQEQADREVAEALAAQEAVTKRLAAEILALEDPQAARIQQLAEEKAGLTDSQQAMVDRREALREQAEADRLAAEAAEREAETTARLQAEILALESPEAARIAQLNQEKAALTEAQKAMVDRREALIRQGEADRALADANEQRVDWRIRRARALGDEETALALTMEQVLRSVPALNRAYAEQTLLAEQAAAAVEKAAATQQRIANLQLQALSALDPAAGKVVSRNRTLADIADPAEREAQRQVYLAEDAAAAREADERAAGQRAAGRAAAAQGIETALGAARQAQAQQAQQLADAEAQLARGREEAGSRLQAAWERETGAFAETAERWRGIATDLRSASAELRLGAPGGAEAARALQVRFLAMAGQAQAGDADAAQQLVGLGDRFLEAALPRARNAEDAARLMDFVARSYDEAALTGDRIVDFNNAQIELLNRQVDGIVDIGGKVDTTNALLRDFGGELAALREEQEAANLAIARNTRQTREVLDRVSAGGTALFTQPAASEEA